MSESNQAIEAAIQALLQTQPPNHNEALKLLTPLVDGASSDPRVPLYYGMALGLAGKKAEAISHAERALTLGNYVVTQASALVNQLKK